MEPLGLEEDAARALSEVLEHVTWWNALPESRREFLASSALPNNVAEFVAHSCELESVSMLSVAGTQALIDSTTPELHAQVPNETINFYLAHRLAHAFRRERASVGGMAAEELFWQVPQVLAVHRMLMTGLHERAGRLRVTDAKPQDRDEPYLLHQTLSSTLWAFFDVLNVRAHKVVPGNVSETTASDGGAVPPDDDHDTDQDGAISEEVCNATLNASDALEPLASRTIDASAVLPVVRLAAWACLYLLEIHPFADGNGRLARILVDTLLARVHPLPVPLVPPDCSLAAARARYIAALREVAPFSCAAGAFTASLWGAGPQQLVTLVLQALVASWRRLRSHGLRVNGGAPDGGV